MDILVFLNILTIHKLKIFMDTHLLSHLDWSYLKQREDLSLDKTFEYLCADFMRIYCELPTLPAPSNNSTYPWIEWEPVQKAGKFYQFQAKYWEDAFEKSKGFEDSFLKIDKSLKAKEYDLDVVYLFSKKDFRKKGKNIKQFIKDINLPSIEVNHFFWASFLSELKKTEYHRIVLEYFDNDKIREEIYQQRDEVQKDDKRVKSIVSTVEKGFSGNNKFYENDLKIAQYHQQKYSIRKLWYVNMSYVLEKYDELENAIADETFTLLWLSSPYDWISDFLYKSVNRINNNNDLKKKYEVEIRNLIPENEEVFVNFWTEGKSILNYVWEKNVIFKDNRNNGG